MYAAIQHSAVRSILFVVVWSLLCCKGDLAAAPAGGEASPHDSVPIEIRWHTDYGQAFAEARLEGKMLLLHFCELSDRLCEDFETGTLTDPMIASKLREYVCAKLPLDTKITIDGKESTLLEHGVFREMLGRPGVAILDFVHREAPYHGCVVSTFPITDELSYPPERMAAILDLPPGTLTQRTLIYAVRIHPERPSSTEGRIDANLVKEAESHSRYQARIRLQGHHHWSTRFHRINAKLPGGLLACEVAAESWPGEKLVEAAIECVRCWRFSSGHWSAVSAHHDFYGYDMKRGSNGIWYATGIFGG
ncbi:MAG: hypothetical protein V3R99_05785 [Thermoguttaceae bacterium]